MAIDNKKNTKELTSGKEFAFAFGKINYIIMGVGLVILLIGYILLSGGGSDDPNVFNEAMFDSRRLVVAPIMITLGLLAQIVAIMVKPCSKKNTEVETLNKD